MSTMYNPQVQSNGPLPAAPVAGPGSGTDTATAAGHPQAYQVAGLASVFRTAHLQLDRDPLLSSSATRDLVSRAHQSLPLLCNLVFGLTPLSGVHDQVLLDMLLPNGPLIQVLVLLANDRTTYVYDMNPSMLPEPSLAKLRSGQLAELPDVYTGRVTSASFSSNLSAAEPTPGGGTMGLRFNMLEFFLFHFAHAPLRMAQLHQQQSSQTTRQGTTAYPQQHGNTTGRRLSDVWESASNVFSVGTGAASGMASQRRQFGHQQPVLRHPLGSHTGLISIDDNKSPPTVYTILLQSYLSFFVPNDASSPAPTIFTPTSSSASTFSSSSSWSPNPQNRLPSALRSPTRQPSATGTATWWASDRLECSKFFVGCLIECWLGQEPYGPTRQEQIKILGKDVLNALYYVVNHISVEALLDVLTAGVPAQVLGLSKWAEAETGQVGLGRIALRAAYHQLSPPLYRFFYSALSHHPLTDSDHGCYAMRQVLSIWIRWITPLPATSPISSESDLHLVDAFVLNNFAYYTTLVHIYLSRALELFPLARPQANTRKPGAGYADDMQGIVQVLMVFAALGADKQPGPTVYHTSVAQLEHVMFGGGVGGRGNASGGTRASLTSVRATLESHMAWLEGTPGSSAGVSRVRSRWRPVLLDVASSPVMPLTEPAATAAAALMGASPSAAGGLVRQVLAEAVLGWHTRKAVLKPYNDEPATATDRPRAPAPATSSSPRSASFAYRMLDLPVLSAGVRAFASTSHVLRPMGVPDAVLAREQKVMGLIVQVAAAVARVSTAEMTEMHTRAAAEVHEFVMQGMAASASPTSGSVLGRGATHNQLHVNGGPMNSTSSGWELPEPLASVARYLFGWAGTYAPPPPPPTSASAATASLSGQCKIARKVDAVDLAPDRLQLSDTGRLQVITGARLCPPVPSMRGQGLPRDLYTTREIPMLVDFAYGVEDMAKAILGRVYGWSVRGHSDLDDTRARAMAGQDWIKLHAQKAGYAVSGFFARHTHTLVDAVGLRNLADRALLAWILALRWAWVLLQFRSTCHFASYVVYPILVWFVIQFPFALEPTPAKSLTINLALMLLIILMLLGSDYGWNPAHFLVAMCAVGAGGIVGWSVFCKWASAFAGDEMAFLGGSRYSSPEHTRKSGPGPQQQQQQPKREAPRTPGQEGKTRGGSRPVSPLAGMKIGQYGSVRS